MRKRAIVLIGLVTLLASCNSAKSRYSFSNVEYPEGTISHYMEDDDMIVDGHDDESHYKGLDEIVIFEPDNKVTLKSKVYFGKNGFYFFNYVDDHSVFYSDELDIYSNDGVEMHIDVNPDYSISLAGLNRKNHVTDEMLQIRTDCSGRMQTWVSNGLPSGYEWTQYHKDCKIAVYVDGKVNRTDAANGYSIEMYVPYSSFGLDKAPEKISFMPAFNNSSSNLDSERKWFTLKGMAHNYPSSWMRVNKDGFLYNGKDIEPEYKLTANRNDEKYDNKNSAVLYEVDKNNENMVKRAEFAAFLGIDGIYTRTITFDKSMSHFNDSIWDNDGIEFYIDTIDDGTDTLTHNGAYRFAFDVDDGLQSDIYIDDYSDSTPYYMGTTHKVSIIDVDTYSDYEYHELYCFEVFVPYESLGISRSEAELFLHMNFAVSSPGESTYILDRRDGIGDMEAQSWLWIDKHYPKNTDEFFKVTGNGLFV